MKTTRKQKLKLRAEKQVKAETWKRQSYQRLLRMMGLARLFETLPAPIHDMFLDRFSPGTEVVAASDSSEDPEVQYVVRELRRLLKRTTEIEYKGTVIELAWDDLYRGYFTILTGIRFFCEEATPSGSPIIKRILKTMEEAQAILLDPEQNWSEEMFCFFESSIYRIRDSGFSITERMISTRHIDAQKPEGGLCDRVIVRLHQAHPHYVTVDGFRRKAYPCSRSRGARGIKQATWNCQDMGIPGPDLDLPVYIDRHAIERLHERLPVPGLESLVELAMVDAMQFPKLTPREPGRYLVEMRVGPHHVGYLVAQVLPALVLVRTFLFITMQGTPEAECLREKLGMGRTEVERYQLDRLFTLTASNIADDPLLSRVLSECGCGHLLTAIPFTFRFDWMQRHGNSLKESLGIRESRDGFVVGQKWVRWSDATTPQL